MGSPSGYRGEHEAAGQALCLGLARGHFGPHWAVLQHWQHLAFQARARALRLYPRPMLRAVDGAG